MRFRERVEWARSMYRFLSVCSGLETTLNKLDAYDGTGFPSGSDGGGRSGSGHGDPTASAALARVDQARRCRNEIFAGMRSTEREANKVVDLINWANAIVSATGEEGCMSCSRTKDRQGRQRWSQVKEVATSVNRQQTGQPRLRTALGTPRHVNLCKACYQMISKYDLDDLPPKEAVTARHEGRRFNWERWLEEHPPEHPDPPADLEPAPPPPGETLYKDWLINEHAGSFSGTQEQP